MKFTYDFFLKFPRGFWQCFLKYFYQAERCLQLALALLLLASLIWKISGEEICHADFEHATDQLWQGSVPAAGPVPVAVPAFSCQAKRCHRPGHCSISLEAQDTQLFLWSPEFLYFLKCFRISLLQTSKCSVLSGTGHYWQISPKYKCIDINWKDSGQFIGHHPLSTWFDIPTYFL